MFRHTRTSQIDLFNNFGNQLSERKQRILDDPTSWHNIFYTEVVSRINEGIFSVLYDEKMGRPNASVQELVGMIILKEGNGWSDEQLFEECRFNILVLRSLGKANMDEDVPTESTYYEFRRLLHGYNEAHDDDLFKKAFQELTIKQMKKYGVQGKKVRMDSKLINSNIARSGRLELIVEALRKFSKKLDIRVLESEVKPQIYELLEDLKVKSTCNVLYPMTSAEKKKMLHQLGPAIKAILKYYEDRNLEGEQYAILRRIFEEQYTKKASSDQPADDLNAQPPDFDNAQPPDQSESSREVKEQTKQTEPAPSEQDQVQPSQKQETKKAAHAKDQQSTKDDQGRASSQDQQSDRKGTESEPEENETENTSEDTSQIEPKDKNQIESSSVQSVHDPDATYRTKGTSHNKQAVKGYHSNITEVCDDQSGLNLIIDGELKTANESEDSFLIDSVTECEKMMEHVHGPTQNDKSHIEEAITDGGYDSIENRKEMIKPERPTWRLAKMKGQKLSFNMECDDEGNFHVWESCSGQKCEVSKSRNGKKFVIKTPAGKVRYFTREEMVDYVIKLKIQANQNKDSYNLRANVESTINQVFHRLGKSKKIKYRRYQPCNTYMLSRMFWTNHRRIARKLMEDVQKGLKNGQNELENLKNGLESLGSVIWGFIRNVVSVQDYFRIRRSRILFLSRC